MPENKEKMKTRKTANNYEEAEIVVSDNDEKKVIDFIEFIKTSNDENAEGIRILLNKYLTEEEVLTFYQQEMSGFENEKTVSRTLGIILKNLSEYISANANGIVLDERGHRLREESRLSAIALGMADEKDFINMSISNDILDMIIEGIVERDRNIKDNWGELNKGTFLEQLYANVSTFNVVGNDIDEFLSRKIEDLKLSNNLKGIILEDRNIFKNSEYEKDLHLYEISKLEMEIDEAQGSGSPILEQLLKKRKDFYDTHKKYIGKVPVRNADGTINRNEYRKVVEFGKAYQRTFILRHLEMFNGMSKDEFENFDPAEKEHLLISALVGLGYDNNPIAKYREIALESKRMLRQAYPELDMSNEKSLENFFKAQLRMRKSTSNFKELIEEVTRKFEYAIDDYIAKDTGVYTDGKPDFSNFRFGVSQRIKHESFLENYFENSEIKFEKKDEDLYNFMYRNSTIDAWIENKEDAIKLRYAALLSVRNEYKEHPSNGYTDKKLLEIDRELQMFEKRFGKVEITPEEQEYFNGYKEQFINAGVMKYLTRDALYWQNGDNFEDLDSTKQKAYIRNILVALDHQGEKNNPVQKMALRRLELMGKQYLTKENGEYKINKDLILQKYNELSEYTYQNYDELLQSAYFRKNEYLLKKLEEYSYLRKEDFLELTDRDDPMLSMEEIDRVRIESNQERIEGRKITDSDLFRAFENGRMTEESLHTNDIRSINGSNNLRHRNQEETENNNSTTESERKRGIEVAELHTSIAQNNVSQNKENKLVNKVKKVFTKIKDRIRELIKGEKEPLKLDLPKIEDETNEDKNENSVITGESSNDPWRRSATPIITDDRTNEERNEIIQEER